MLNIENFKEIVALATSVIFSDYEKVIPIVIMIIQLIYVQYLVNFIAFYCINKFSAKKFKKMKEWNPLLSKL